jgi:hypothetical protein
MLNERDYCRNNSRYARNLSVETVKSFTELVKIFTQPNSVHVPSVNGRFKLNEFYLKAM